MERKTEGFEKKLSKFQEKTENSAQKTQVTGGSTLQSPPKKWTKKKSVLLVRNTPLHKRPSDLYNILV